MAHRTPTSGCKQVGDDKVATLLSTTIEVPRNGYLYIYTSNETKNIDVYFDNLQLSHTRSPLLEENNYYAFGGDIKALCSKAMKGLAYINNNAKFNSGTEFNDDLDIALYETPFRNYNAQIGRFQGLDKLAESSPWFTPMQFGGNNPISFNDPSGLAHADPHELPHVVVSASIPNHPTPEPVYAGDPGHVNSSDIYGPTEDGWCDVDNGGWHPFSNVYTGISDYTPSTPEAPYYYNTPHSATMLPRVNNSFDQSYLEALQASNDSIPSINKILSEMNKYLGFAGYAEGAVGAIQIGMIQYRKSLDIADKIGTFARFRSIYSALSGARKFFGKLGYIGAAVTTIVDYKAMQRNEISPTRFVFRTTGTLSSIFTGAMIGRYFGGAWGAVGGAAIGLGFSAGEKAYDGFNWWKGEMETGINNYENALQSGWMPFRY